ncbi:unnamed protein product [Gongylonema pulchrum]|uniref:Uncharacterized protein n=1 Tax=Gongylonema pulchrum TaxID=637853 RepID=A0A3P6SLI9_9BILA|nr:unnamed protein product [Gongylonema pulchrum]
MRPLSRASNTSSAGTAHVKFNWKAINIDSKHVIFRCNGICKDNPKYNVHTVGDPRNALTRFRSSEAVELPIPSFVVS